MGVSNHLIRNRIMSLACVALAALVILPTSLFAQEKLQRQGGSATLSADNPPVLIVTVASANKLMEDVNYVTGIVGQPQVGGIFQMMAASSLQGVDMTQPVAIMVPIVDDTPEPIAVIPTKNVKNVLNRLRAQIGPVDELDDGTLAIAVGVNTIYIRQNGNWATAARNRDLLGMVPADPTSLFKGMGNAYDLAMRVKLQQVPAESRDMVIQQLRTGFEGAMAQQNDQAAREMAENSIKQLETMIQETDELSFGINIDPVGKKMVWDFSFTAVPGSDLADMYAGQKPIPSMFASVIRPNAAAFFHGASSISPTSVEQARTSMQATITTIRSALMSEDNLSASEQAEISAIIDRIADLAIDSIAEGKSDVGALLLADQDEFRFVMGAFVSDGNAAADLVKDLADKVKNEPDAPEFKFDVSTYKGVNMHVVEAEVPASEDEVRRIFGEVLRVHIGTGPKSVYLAIGDDSEAEMKRLIDAGASDPGGKRPLGQFHFTLLPVLEYAQSIEENEVVAAMITALVAAPDPGLVRIVSDGIPNGQTSTFSIGEGLIKGIAAGVMAAQQGQFRGQF